MQQVHHRVQPAMALAATGNSAGADGGVHPVRCHEADAINLGESA
jgi:hypothetical protein